ncbi:MAG: hypothetical protein ABFS45_09060 [Pseudomonadota bacterium]
MDYYLVDTGGDWTATQARFESAAADPGKTAQIIVGADHVLQVDWQSGRGACQGGGAVFFSGAQRICRYMNYPLSYEVFIQPPVGPEVTQIEAKPSGTQGRSASYRSGFSFTIGGGVNVSGKGPSAGVQAGISWSNSVQTTVPPMVIDAGDTINEGASTKYKYCTVGTTLENCTSTIQMVGASGACRRFVVGEPQNGQTPNGRLSDVAQTVYWRVDPATYDGETFDITVTFKVDLATSTADLWYGHFVNPGGIRGYTGPNGHCNQFGCNCGLLQTSSIQRLDHTFKVPFPSSTQCPSDTGT